MTPLACLIVSLFCGIIGMVFGFIVGVEESKSHQAETPNEAKTKP